METGRTSPAIVDADGNFRIRPLTRAERQRLDSSHSTRNIRTARSDFLGATALSLGEFSRAGGSLTSRGTTSSRPFTQETTPRGLATRGSMGSEVRGGFFAASGGIGEASATGGAAGQQPFLYFVDGEFQSFGQHNPGEVPSPSKADTTRYQRHKLKSEQKLERDRPFTSPSAEMFMFPSPKVETRAGWGKEKQPNFLLQAPKGGYWKDESYKAKRHAACYGNYEAGRTVPIPPAFEKLKKSKWPKRNLKPNAYYRRVDVA